MIVVHVRITCSDDYVARRAPVRQAHIERLFHLRAGGTLVRLENSATDGKR